MNCFTEADTVPQLAPLTLMAVLSLHLYTAASPKHCLLSFAQFHVLPANVRMLLAEYDNTPDNDLKSLTLNPTKIEFNA